MPKNRYGDLYYYEHIRDDVYMFVIEGDGGFMRFGGKEGQEAVNMQDLGMFDPSGGPYVAIGSRVFPDEVAWADESFGIREVTHIACTDGEIYVTLEAKDDA